MRDMATKTKKQQPPRARKPGLRYIVDAKGKKTEVVLPIEVYEELLERLEDAEDIQAIEEAMKAPEFIPWEEAERQLDELSDSD